MAVEPAERLTACPDCDLLLALPELGRGEQLLCPRCAAVLARGGRQMTPLLALSLAGVVLWLASLLLPMLVLESGGQQQSVTLWQAPVALLAQQEWLLAMLVAMTTLVAPAVQLLIMLWLLVPVHLGRRPWGVGWMFRVLHANQVWIMLEVFFLGVLVTAVKLADMASVIPGGSLASFIGLMLVMSAVSVLLEPDVYWRAVDKCR